MFLYCHLEDLVFFSLDSEISPTQERKTGFFFLNKSQTCLPDPAGLQEKDIIENTPVFLNVVKDIIESRY